MFKKSSVNKQLGLFSTPSNLMCKRESKQYDDELEWHSQFFRNVTCNIDEEVFRPLYTERKFGAPTKHIRQLVAMNILKARDAQTSRCSRPAVTICFGARLSVC